MGDREWVVEESNKLEHKMNYLEKTCFTYV